MLFKKKKKKPKKKTAEQKGGKALGPAPVKVIGPQLGLAGEPGAVRVTVAFPPGDFPDLKQVGCVLLDESGGQVGEAKVSAIGHENKEFGQHAFDFKGLEAGRKYRYKFLNGSDNEIPLQGGLSYDDCWFYGPAFDEESDKFVLLSCNNPFHSGHDEPEKQFAMWRRLKERVDRDGGKTIRLIVQGGDQVYHDRIERFCVPGIEFRRQPSDEKIREQVVRNYQHFYGDLDYRKLLACIPSVAMLDDHDITDGWGGREEMFFKKGKGEVKPDWERFFRIAYGAFRAYQAAKNPPPLLGEDGPATTFLDMGRSRFILMDLRFEKNRFTGRLMDPPHKAKVMDAIATAPERIFLLSPVVPIRIDPLWETGVGWLTTWASKRSRLWGTRANWCEKVGFHRIAHFFSKVEEAFAKIGCYSDDIYDALGIDPNLPYFLALMEALHKRCAARGKEAVILSGDIHTGGISEIFMCGPEFIVPQIVSSPVGYETMPKLAKNATTTEGYKKIWSDSSNLHFRNIFYRSDRNFAVITPGRLGQADGVEFHFERQPRPIYCPAYFARREGGGERGA